MSKKILGWVGCFVIAMVASSDSASAMGRALEGPGGKIKIATDMPKEQGALLVKDLKTLRTLKVSQQDSELLQTLNLSEASASSLEQWLNDRVQYIVAESFNVKESLTIVREIHSYDNPGIAPIIETPASSTNNNDPNKIKTVMSNIGAATYYVGKTYSTLVGLKVPGHGTVAITSPRTGVIQVGEGLFRSVLRKKGGTELDSMGNTISRLDTFFHEARHSDGNGKSLGFFHAPCPKGHAYEGRSACDRNLNGPYTVGALVNRSLTEACEGCSEAEREALKLEALDSFSRVITVTEVPRNNSLDQVCLESYALRDRYNLRPDFISESCRELEDVYKGIKRLEDLPKKQIPSTAWNDAPEGRRQ